MRTRCPDRLGACSLLALLGLTAGAFGHSDHARAGQTYAIDWYLMGSGGTTESSQGEYRLQGSIAQPVIGSSTGGGYSLDAGFWYGIAPTCPDCIFYDGFESED